MRYLVLLAILTATAHAQGSAVSPGKLARPHARFEAQCERCHAGGDLPPKLCLACHTRLAARIADNAGFHATVTGKPCTECHRDHQGRGFAMAPQPPASFDHRASVFPLDGAHAQLGCARCHTRKWVGVPTACVRCHHDRTHRGQLGSQCATCHRADGWKTVTHTSQDHRLSLAGGHARLRCASCHRGGRHLVEQQTCTHCHTKTHRGTEATCETCHAVTSWKQVSYIHRTRDAKIAGGHAALPCLGCHPKFDFETTPTSCLGCHDRQRPHRPLGTCDQCHSVDTWATTTFPHQMPDVGFALDGAHAVTTCESCHVRPIRWNQPRRTCTSCHADVHGTQFTARVCTDCHTTSAWQPSRITPERHDGFAFVLRDSHRRVACNRCHATGSFVGSPTACASCHRDLRHRGRFGTACERCHDATKWNHTPAFDHAVTGFALERAHRNVACVRCHGRDGRALAQSPAPTACWTCHASPHDRHFATECTQCHTTTTWRDVARFDHARTDFPLTLRHATLRCTACHDAKRRSLAQPACRSCHGDPHRGSNSWQCDECHRPDRWRVVRFDHDLTDYPLSGRHRLTACGGCHTNPNWTGVRTDCAGCHAFARPRDDLHATELVCEDCHTTTRWQAVRRR